jgi:inosose dehydratase
MPKLAIDSIIKHIAALGFDGIEIAVLPHWSTELSQLNLAERRRIARLLAEYGLALPAISAFLSMIEPDAEKFAENLAYVQRAIDLAVDWAQSGKPPIVITGIGGRRGELEANRAQLVDRLQALGDYARVRGVSVAIEAHIDTAIETPESMVDLLQTVGSPAIRANFDISHFNVLGIPIEESVAKLMPYAVHAHIKDERGRYPAYQYVIPGEGEFDYVRYLQAMQACNYDGFISVEISMQVQRRTDYDPLAAATQSYQVLTAAFDKAAIKYLI